MHYCNKNKYLNMEIYAQNIENKCGEVQLFALHRSGVLTLRVSQAMSEYMRNA